MVVPRGLMLSSL